MNQITTHSPEQTQLLAQCIGQQLQNGIVIRLYGDLGSGKTCFTQGLAKGLDVPEGYDITSPTYTLIHEYPARLPLYHIDLYRLGDGVDAEMIGLYEIFGFNAVAVVEWSERLSDDAWPKENLKIELSINESLGESLGENLGEDTGEDDSRNIRLFGYGLATDNLIMEAIKMYERLK